MDSFEWNKVAAALLIGLLLFMGVTFLSEGLFPKQEGEGVGLDGTVVVENDAPVETVELTIIEALVTSSPVAGERSFRKCQACHTVNEGGNNGVGPNLYNVLGAPIGSHDGYSYSAALTDTGETWTYENLDAFLASPSRARPGTKMSFAGIRTVEERANLIAYLRLQSSDPMPLPEAVPAEEVDAVDEAAEEASEEATEDGGSQ